jgi:hypothetical protein
VAEAVHDLLDDRGTRLMASMVRPECATCGVGLYPGECCLDAAAVAEGIPVAQVLAELHAADPHPSPP